jgi:hypothetical protein
LCFALPSPTCNGSASAAIQEMPFCCQIISHIWIVSFIDVLPIYDNRVVLCPSRRQLAVAPDPAAIQEIPCCCQIISHIWIVNFINVLAIHLLSSCALPLPLPTCNGSGSGCNSGDAITLSD